MKKLFAFSIIILLVVSATVIVVYYDLLGENKETKPFYVGVTYCGESVEEAKLLIDKVKNYTNLFVLQSGPLQRTPEKMNEICEYAVSSGMYFIVYFGNEYKGPFENWLNTCENLWGDRFLGVYYGDEMGGKMLDSDMMLRGNNASSTTRKTADGRIILTISANSTVMPSYGVLFRVEYSPNVTISTVTLIPNENDTTKLDQLRAVYYSNGTITGFIQANDGTITSLENSTTKYQLPSYDSLLQLHPLQNFDETAELYVETQQNHLAPVKNRSVTAFTSDYALYWFDYLAGYDVLLAQFGWNHTLVQDIALARGAAQLQNKTWGAIITWKYNNPPYLDSGEAIYDQMLMAYEAGAEYVVLFNYSEEMEGAYGTLQEEHFTALERFWNEVVQSPAVKQGSVKAEASLVLPKNYGWGMRNPEDTIWGVFEPDEKSQQIWELSRNLLEQYGLSLDIVYDDPEFPAAGKYPQVYYWNHTG